jgi:predicted deacetylase
MRARYLVRFDDLCPTMNWDIWARIESALIEREIRPLLAVIPDNQDKSLAVAPAHTCFWKQVRKWQAMGWTIGLHGYQHRFVNQNAGMVGIQRRSEFAGLPPTEQERKLRRAIEIFRSEEIEPQAWIAPAHSFDKNTVVGLAKTGFAVISDGLALAPHTDEAGMFWVPQQIWQFRWRPFGVWTVCYHHNHWGEMQLHRFLRDVEKYGDAITDLASVRADYRWRRRGVMDSVYSVAHSMVLSLHAKPGVSA